MFYNYYNKNTTTKLRKRLSDFISWKICTIHVSKFFKSRLLRTISLRKGVINLYFIRSSEPNGISYRYCEYL